MAGFDGDLGAAYCACPAVRYLYVSIWDCPLICVIPVDPVFLRPLPVLLPLLYLHARLPVILPAALLHSALLS